MVTQLKKALYISTSILFTNVFILNSNAETNTATDIMSGIANSFSTTINQQENDLAEEQTTQKTDINTNTSEQNQENATSEATPDNINTDSETEDSVIKQTIDSSNTVISDQNNDPNSTDIPTTSTAKIGFIDQNGNILIAPKETVFPSEMKDGELYYFSRDVEKAKENIKNNIIPNENGQQPVPLTPSTNSNVVAPGQLPQQNNIPQTQNPTVPNESGQQTIPSTPPTNSVVIPGQLPQQNIPQSQPAIPNENGQHPIPSTPPTNSNAVPGQLPQNNIPQPQNPTVPNENGQQPIPSTPSTNSDVIPGQLPQQNNIPQSQNPASPNENGQQPIPSNPSTNGDVVPGQLPQQNPDIQPTKTPGIPASFDLDKTGKKPIMFQCYLA